MLSISQDTLARKVNSSDASEYAHMIGCCGSRFWGELLTLGLRYKAHSHRGVLAAPGVRLLRRWDPGWNSGVQGLMGGSTGKGGRLLGRYVQLRSG